MSLLKRSFSVSSVTADFTFFHDLAARAAADLPGNKTLAAMNMYSLMRMGRYREAVEFGKGIAQDDRFETLTGEAYIRAGIQNMEEMNLQARPRNPVLAAASSRNPDFFLNAARITNDARFTLDGALICLENGDIDRAVSLVRNGELDPWPVLSLRILYDAGLTEEAEYYMNLISVIHDTLPSDVELIFDDIAVIRLDYAEAKKRLRETISSYPRISWIPYFNLARLSMDDTFRERISYAEEGYRLFPAVEEITLLIGNLYEGEERYREAMEAYDRYLDNNTASRKIQYARLSGSTGSNPGRFESGAWNLLSDPETPEAVYRSFAWYLIGIRAYDQALTVIRRAEQRFTGNWTSVLNGLCLAGLERYEEAEISLQKAVSGSASWEIWFDLAMIQEKRGDFGAAVTSMRNAITDADKANSEIRGRLFAFLSYYLYRRGDIESAKREYLYARELSPDDLITIMLKRILEEDR